MSVHKIRSKPSRNQSAYEGIQSVQTLATVWCEQGRQNVIQYLKKAHINHDQLEVFHLWGTNGKGSVCHMLSASLRACGERVGMMISPHLVSINERLQVDGVPIWLDKLNDLYEHVINQSEQWWIPLSFFEVQVIVAIIYFLDQQVDSAIVEVGMWGIHDATNIWQQPVATYITSIWLEHSHVLGKSRPTILKKKLGIIKEGSPLFTPYDNETIRTECEKVGVTHISVKKPKEILTNLPGHHQQTNAALVLTSLMHLGYDESRIRWALLSVVHPGRLQKILPHVIVDTANNKQSIRLLIETLWNAFFEQEWVEVIFGSTQRDPEIIWRLIDVFPDVRFSLVEGFYRSKQVEGYAHLAQRPVSHIFRTIPELSEYLSKSFRPVLLTGSLYLVWEVMKELKIK